MHKLGQKVCIVADHFEQNLPIGSYAYIIAYERSADNAFDYVIRVPKLNKQFYVPAVDIELEEVLLRMEAEKIERESLIDFALSTHNEELFNRIMNGEHKLTEEKEKSGSLSSDEFIRQVNLKAWI